MKSWISAVFVAILVLMAAPSFAVNQDVILPVENWIKVGEEREILAHRVGAGIIKRYYVDPMQRNGIGSTISVFYKDGSEELLWKGWDLYTDKGRYAVKFKNDFYLAPTVDPMTSNMMTLGAMIDHLKKSGFELNPKMNVSSFQLCLMDENHDFLKTPAGEKVCAVFDFTKLGTPSPNK